MVHGWMCMCMWMAYPALLGSISLHIIFRGSPHMGHKCGGVHEFPH